MVYGCLKTLIFRLFRFSHLVNISDGGRKLNALFTLVSVGWSFVVFSVYFLFFNSYFSFTREWWVGTMFGLLCQVGANTHFEGSD